MSTNSYYQTIINRLTTNPDSACKGTATDFFNKFTALQELRYLAEHNSEDTGPETITFISNLLLDTEFSHQRQVYFYYRQAAETLRSFVLHSSDPLLSSRALGALRNALYHTDGPALRATAESMSSLPFPVNGPEQPLSSQDKIPRIPWQSIFRSNGFNTSGNPQRFGRSLVFKLRQPHRDCLLVLKLAKTGDSPQDLAREAFWMEFFQTGHCTFEPRFNIPIPLQMNNSRVFRVKDIPDRLVDRTGLHPAGYAIGFIAHRDYFVYPNDGTAGQRIGDLQFKEIMLRNAWLLGKLASLGIVHCAPIPLFHNRVQAGRRNDHGLYQWFRAGRLDRWLASCAYPNLGPTGIRDFEHFIAFRGWNRNLYRHIGNHLLSLLLVTGSYFRNKKPSLVGLDKSGNPVDARCLFEQNALKEIVRGVFIKYYHGFSGTEFCDSLPFDLDRLVRRMIDEMGVDRHMAEILRVADQKDMTDKVFRRFLCERGYDRHKIDRMEKGEKDIVINSGPHLGEFNHTISLPEIIDSVGSVSALCMAGRYQKENVHLGC